MPRAKRKSLEKILCHHMVQGINKEYIFQKNEEKQKYLELMQKYYLEFQIDIIAYCIMDNHAHFLLYSDKIQNISNFMQKINSIYAMDYNKNKQRVGYVFRNRFESVPILKKEQMYTCIKYIHMNPVKANLVKNEGNYKYSSYNDYIHKSGFINNRILELVFNSTQNYVEEFQNIEYQDMNFEKNKIEIKEEFEKFLIQENLEFKEVRKNKDLIQKFILYLDSQKYKYSKTQLANVLQIGRTTFYRWFYE